MRNFRSSKDSLREVHPVEDEQVVLNNACADLVSLEKCEAFPARLLAGKPGEWVGVRSLCMRIGIDPGEVNESVFALWLPDPVGDENYAVIIFYDAECLWTMAANYNRKRLLQVAAAAAGQTAARVS